MPRAKNIVAWAVVGTLLSLVIPMLGAVIARFAFPDFRLSNLPLHALVESAGGLIALAIAGILLIELEHKPDSNHYAWLATSFASMGVLDLFHAACSPGTHFVWLRTVASLVGGIFVAGVWVSPRVLRMGHRATLPVVTTLLAILLGVVSILGAEQLPPMRVPAGSFSTLAVSMNAISGVGFLAASVFFARRFIVTGEREDWLFVMQMTLFGTAGLLFNYSAVWDGAWWWWHLLRLAGYIASLTYGLQAFREAERDLRQFNHDLNSANESLQEERLRLDRTVEERTAALRAIEERFELAVRGSTDGLWDWNVLTNEVYFSARLKELWGFGSDELPSEFAAFESRLHPDDHDWVLAEVDAHLKQRKPYDVEYRIRMKSGEYRWFRARGQAIWGASGQPLRMAGSVTDVTEEHRLRERFRLAVEASPAALLMVGEDGQILMANSRSLVLFGYKNSELIGQLVEVLVPPRFRAGHPAHRNQFFSWPEQRAMGAELDLLGVRQDGSEFPVKVGLSPIELAEGRAVICGVIDISVQKKALAAMQQAKEAAESASRAKSSFLANMSHEIRTPMNGIIGMAQLLGQTELRSHQRDYLATVEESAHVLLRLLNDILDFSKIEAGKLELENVGFRVSECLARASQMLMLRAAEKGLEIACRIAPEIPDHLRGDPGRLQQVLVNLLGNAVKFTEAGEIYVNVNIEHSSSRTHESSEGGVLDSDRSLTTSADSVRLHFSVTDTGIGIPADMQDQIFRPFEQAEASTTRRFGGTGLGLTISRQLVEMMRGRLWVESESGRGSTFHFTAEFGIAADQHLHEPAELDSLLDLPVLVVDDNFTNRRILSEMLQYWRMQPILADSAAAARQALQKADDSQRPVRLILLDHHMPGEDGLQFAQSIHDRLQHDRCPVIMISSGSTLFDSDQCQKLGIGRCMTKPVIASELLNEVLRQFGRSLTAHFANSTPADDASRTLPRRVLLVEDNEINRRVAIGLLRSRGHQVLIAENGRDALTRLESDEFDVVLMDIQMPIMDGYEATAAIRKREHETGGHIPIVAMTAEALKGDRDRCLAAGMDDYVSKPITPAEMFRAVERFPAVCIPADSVRPLPNEPAATTTSEPTTTTSSVESAIVDWEVAKHRLGPEVAVLREFVELVTSQTATLMSDIRRAIDTRDAKLLRRAAHTLKGSVNYFGAESLIKAALGLETHGREESFDGVADAFAVVEQELVRVLAALAVGPPDAPFNSQEMARG